MSAEPITGQLFLRRGRERPLRAGHPWVFSGAIERVAGAPAAGDLVGILDAQGAFLATAYYNPRSQIRARVLSFDPHEPIDDAFWAGRIDRAVAARETLALAPATSAYRLVYAESDGLPGLVVDRYDDFLVMQCLTLGVDRRREKLARLLADRLAPAGIFERSDASVRAQEGLSERREALSGAPPPPRLTIRENNLPFEVDLLRGHKTGFYLDQRDNRALLGQRRWVAGRAVLNVFAYTGGFGAYAARAGAASVVNVDSAVPVLELAERNVTAVAGERPEDEYIAGNAFEVLRHFRDTARRFDVAILDPPKFVAGRGDIQRGSRGYKDINLLALQLLTSGGLLVTFSCSGHVDEALFQKILHGAARDAGRDAQILHRLAQGPDHPVLLSFPESAYLKGFLARVW